MQITKINHIGIAVQDLAGNTNQLSGNTYFTTGEGKALVLKLSREDGR